jgi:hypothetical protein
MIYRKAKNAKVFYRIDGYNVATITIKEKRITIDVVQDLWTVAATATDSDTTIESTEAEFNAAHKLANPVCSMLKIV